MPVWLDDLKWAVRMVRARRHRRTLYFSGRMTFDAALRPSLDEGLAIAYPAALYHVRTSDLQRAIKATLPRSADHAAPLTLENER